jgi:hypothetical protein
MQWVGMDDKTGAGVRMLPPPRVLSYSVGWREGKRS